MDRKIFTNKRHLHYFLENTHTHQQSCSHVRVNPNLLVSIDEITSHTQKLYLKSRYEQREEYTTTDVSSKNYGHLGGGNKAYKLNYEIGLSYHCHIQKVK